MSSDFDPPPLWQSISATAGGIVTAIALVIGFEVWSSHLDRKLTPSPTASATPTHHRSVSCGR